MSNEIVSFDWALKYVLRDKANFAVLEGLFAAILFLLLRCWIYSKARATSPTKMGGIRLDLKARFEDGEIAIIEFQYKPEHHFFRRLLFYTSQTVVEHVRKGSQYEDLPKIYTISVCSFKLGNGEDYVYRGQQKFVGIHSHEELELDDGDRKRLRLKLIDDVFPEYIIVSLTNFDETARSNSYLDEWLYALKTGQIEDSFKAPGIDLAAERLDLLKMDDFERLQYRAFSIQQRIELNQARAAETDREILLEAMERKALEKEKKALEQGREEGLNEVLPRAVKALASQGMVTADIARALQIDESKVVALLNSDE